MLKDFKLKIDNFGSINEADLDISKINIIAGKNASGKTTISKLLYCIVTAFSTDGKYLIYENIKEQMMSIINSIQFSQQDNIKEVDEIRFEIGTDREYKIETIEKNYEKLEKIINSLDLSDKNFFLDNIKKNKIRISRIKEIGRYWIILTDLIKNEFSGGEQLINNFKNSEITLYNDDNVNQFEYYVRIREGIGVGPKTKYNNRIMTNYEAIYIETPYFLDYKIPFSQVTFPGKKQYHQELLFQKLIDQSSKNNILDNINNDDIIKFQKTINEEIGGEFKFNNVGLLEFNQNNKIYELPNTSTGIKSLGIIQLLLENRKLNPNTFLIMDEPEVHLHPEWQVKLAKILVLLVKDLNVKLFINSHSPQFIEAIEVYSVKYGLKDDTRFYLTEKDEKSKKYNIKQISLKNLYSIYDNLGDPYDIIDKVRGENIANHLGG